MSRSLAVVAVALTLSVVSAAQVNPQIMTQVSAELASGIASNPTTQPQIVWSQVLTIPTAGCMQLVFDVADLAREDDAVVVTSLTDNQVQVLNPVVMKHWRNHSAWFNGSAVLIELRLSPKSSGQVTVGSAFIYQTTIAPPVGVDSQCGTTDDRVLSSDSRVCRLLGNGFVCTGWLINGQNMLLSAGHCGIPANTSALITAQFNVPLSTTGGSIINPPVADQFPVDQQSIIAVQNAIGDDYAAMRLHPNSTGQTALQHMGGASFSLAGSLPLYLPPFIIPTLRVTGCGADSGIRNFVQQTAVGPYTGASGTMLTYQVDTEGGDSGAPVIDDSNGLAIGIHTNAGCGSSSGSNSGTSILNGGLQNAITNTGVCGSTSLSNGSPATITCSPRYVNTTTASSDWVVLAASSASDWDLHVESVFSTFGGTACDYVLANGNLGSVAPTGGEVYLFSGGPNATAEFQVATTSSTGVQNVGFFGSTEIIEVYQFNITSAGAYDIALDGDTSLTWQFHAPGANNGWRARSSAGQIASGTVGGAPTLGLTLGTGWHCLVVTRNGGPAATSGGFTFSVCQSVAPVALAANVAQTITNACQGFSLTPTAGIFNVVAVTGASDWDIAIGAGYSRFGGSTTDFCIADGHAGAISPSSGAIVRFLGSSNATAEHATAATGTVGTPFDTALASGSIVDVVQFNVPSAGSYDVSLSGDTSLGFVLMGSQAPWNDRTGAITAGIVGNVNTVSLGAGWHAVVVTHDGGPAATTLPYTVHLCATAAIVNLSPSTVATTLTNPCQPFTIAPTSGQWNAVGVTSTSDWDVVIATAESQFGSSICDFVVANGTLGAVSPTLGMVSRFFGTANASLNQATLVTPTIGTPYGAAWGSGQAIRIFQFNVATAGSYDITLTGVAGLDWFLFEPGTDSAWRVRANANVASVVGAATTTRTLGTGAHAIIVSRSGGVGLSGSFTVDIEPTPNPVPTLSTISPTTAVAGSGAFTLTCTGTNFVASSVVQWDGVAQATTFVNATSLTASIPAALVAAAGTHTVTVSTPAPGGGTTSGLTFTVTNPAPSISSISPASATAGGGAFVITANGSNFNTQSRVQWNGANLTTTFVSATQLTATVPAGNIATAGSATVRVNNPAPGGGTTANLTFTINNPVPTLTGLSPSSILAGSAAFTLTVTGTNCNAQSIVTWNGTNLATTFVSSTQLQATVPAGNITAGGLPGIRIFNPAPGGGTSAPLTFTINNPPATLSSISPSSVAAGSAAFTLTVTGTNYNSQSQIRWDGNPQTTTFISSTQLSASIPASLIATAGTAQILVRNPGPAGGNSVSLPLGIIGPAITSITPVAIAVKTLASPPTTLTVSGSGYLATSKVFANGVQLTTTFVNATTLTASLPASVQQTQSIGGIWISVQNFPTVASNFSEVIVGTGANHGTIGHVPLADPVPPGVVYSFNMEGCAPNAAFVLSGDTGMPAPIGNWPTAAANLVLSVGSPGLFPVLDGIGVYGPAQPGIVTSPNQPGNTAPGGKFVLTGLTNPNPPLGLHFTLQASYLDPSSPVGFRNTWAFVNTSL